MTPFDKLRTSGGFEVPRMISSAQRLAYLRTLADTGNATLAAAHAGVSREWAYKKRKADARFDRLWREMVALAKARLPARVNRDRADGWTAEKEARFIERLGQTCSVWLASAEVGLTTTSAYNRRRVRPGFAAAWDEARRIGWPPADKPWMEAAICFFEGTTPSPGNPVRFTSISEVLEAMKGNLFGVRRPRRR
jgi:hypothetical protein